MIYLTSFYCRAISQKQPFAFDLKLFGEVIAENTKWTSTDRKIIITLCKKNDSEEWPRLTENIDAKEQIPAYLNNYSDEEDENIDSLKHSGMNNKDGGLQFEGVDGMRERECIEFMEEMGGIGGI